MEVFKNDECVVCLEKNSVPVFVPCGHQCCCVECVDSICRAKMPCPLCRAVIASVKETISLNDTVKDAPSDMFGEFISERRDEYVAKLRKHVAGNAGFVGKSKLARGVNRECGSELELRQTETRGTERVTAKKQTIKFEIKEGTLLVDFKIGRKTHHESHPYMELEDAKKELFEALDGDTIELVECATWYPEFYWCFYYHTGGGAMVVDALLKEVGIDKKIKRY